MNDLHSIGKSFLYFFWTKGAAREEYRQNWGKRFPDKYRRFKAIRRLFDLTCDQNSSAFVDDRVWDDLDMDLVFAQLDACVTPMGKQVLYRSLRTYQEDLTDVANSYTEVTHLRKNEQLAQELQLELHAMKDDRMEALTGLLFDDLPKKPAYYQLLYLQSFASLLSLAAIAFSPIFIYSSVGLTIVNLVIAIRSYEKIHHYSTYYETLGQLLKTAQNISKMKMQVDLQGVGFLKEHAVEINNLRWGFSLMSINRVGGFGVVNLLIHWLNLVCIVDYVTFLRSIDRLRNQKKILTRIFECIGNLDSSISIANYLETVDYHVEPTYVETAGFDLIDVVHPLIDQPVPNDFGLENMSALILGSNMAGKTTMIKTVGVNLILAQTIGIALAKSATLSRTKIYTSIKREESIVSGRSYYFVEIELLLNYLKRSGNESGCLFLLDEIYRGTNTVERISASTAVLKQLATTSHVMVTTHDVELQALLADKFDIYHFRENADLKDMFSYKIHSGPCATRNAIALLKLIGYPSEVTTAAEGLAGSLKSPMGGD